MTKDRKWLEKLSDSYRSGKMCDAYRFFGSSKTDAGVDFTVWAPFCDRAFVKYGEKLVPMEKYGDIWYAEIPEEVTEYRYLFEKDGEVFEKNDPFAFSVNGRFKSVFCSIEGIKCEKAEIGAGPMKIYELHTGSWIKDGCFSSVSDSLPEYLSRNGYNYVELMPVHFHPCRDSWGYQAAGYFAFSYGKPQDFAEFVNKMHKYGIGVIVDFVPGHFANDSFGLSMFDGGCVFESDDESVSQNILWGSVNTDFSKGQVRSFMLSSACYLADVFGVDGIRVDALSNMLIKRFDGYRTEYNDGVINYPAVDFLKDLTYELKGRGVLTIAEDSAGGFSATGDLGFDRVWNMGWFHDSFIFLSAPPSSRSVISQYILKPFEYMNNENYILPLSHDENVHGKRSVFGKLPKDNGRSFRLMLGYMAAFPGDKLWFSGTEAGAEGEWSVGVPFEKNRLSDALLDYSRQINNLLSSEKALWGKNCRILGFEDGILKFIRVNESDEDDFLIFIFNFTDTGYDNYCVGIDRFTEFKEVFVTSGERMCRSYPPEAYSINENLFRTEVNLPPLCGIALKPEFSWKKY